MFISRANARGASLALRCLYLLIALTPLAIVAVLRPPTEEGFIYTTGKNFAMVGFTLLAMQFVLSARLFWIERPLGLDLLFAFHKAVAVIALSLLVVHPVLLATGSKSLGLIFGVKVPWYIWLGRLTLIILWMHATVAMFRSLLRLEYQRWRRLHNIAAVCILPLGFVHSWNAGDDLALAPLRVFWVALAAMAAGSYLWHRVGRERVLARHAYRVSDVQRETDKVWTITMTPPPGEKRFQYLPGQFQFITFRRSPGLPVEEHHWTISSSPSGGNSVSATIKESGDFTSSIGKTQPGDTALVLGPYGRFSHLLHPEERDLVFIAGGIGITPLMSMLRFMRDTSSDNRVLLLYANRKKEEIVFLDELSRMAAGGKPNLTIVHFLSQSDGEMPCEVGHMNQERIERHCGGKPGMREKAFYICAPPALSILAAKWIRESGVRDDRIHGERFAL